MHMRLASMLTVVESNKIEWDTAVSTFTSSYAYQELVLVNLRLRRLQVFLAWHWASLGPRLVGILRHIRIYAELNANQETWDR